MGNLINTNTIGTTTRNFVTSMSTSSGYAPIILLEAAVTGGRTYQAYKRGGFVEARERGTEETLGAIFWLGGAHAFNKMGDALGAKVFGAKNFEFDVAKDTVRQPFKNFISDGIQNGKTLENKIAAFKFGKVVTSLLLANAVIGFVVPKLNQKITNHYQNSIKKAKNEQPLDDKTRETSIDSFVSQGDKDKGKTSFKGLKPQMFLSMADKLERDPTCKLIATDVGVVSGRTANARNKHEKTEVLVRDVGSIYFYMFCKDHINAGLNRIQTGKSGRLDPNSTVILDNHLKTVLNNGAPMNVEQFKAKVFGNKNAALPELNLVNDNDTITLEDFKKAIKGKSFEAKLDVAQKMAKLQPEIDGKAILTKAQIKDIYTGGHINDPEFLNIAYNAFTKNKSTDKMKYVSEESLRGLKERMTYYVEQIIASAQKAGKDVSTELLTKANRKNFLMNGLNLGLGLGISAFFLSTVIPKIQYWITEKHTGENKFPGIQKYEK